MLCVFNFSTFFAGIAFIVVIEFLLYKKMMPNNYKGLFGDVLYVNLWSFLFFLGGSILIPLAFSIGTFFKNKAGLYCLSIGTWVSDNSAFPNLAIIAVFFWDFILFLIIIYFEAFLLKKRWRKRNEIANSLKISIVINTSSSAFFILLGLIIWNEIFW